MLVINKWDQSCEEVEVDVDVHQKDANPAGDLGVDAEDRVEAGMQRFHFFQGRLIK